MQNNILNKSQSIFLIMSKIEQLIATLSEGNLQDSYVERINAIRSNVKDGNVPISVSKAIATQGCFEESWDTFEDSTDWDNSWDQGIPS